MIGTVASLAAPSASASAAFAASKSFDSAFQDTFAAPISSGIPQRGLVSSESPEWGQPLARPRHWGALLCGRGRAALTASVAAKPLSSAGNGTGRPVRLGRRRVAGHALAPETLPTCPVTATSGNPALAREMRSDYRHMLVVRRTTRVVLSAPVPAAWLASHIERSCNAIAVEHLTCSDVRL